MSINPSEITKLLKDQIKNFGEKLKFQKSEKFYQLVMELHEFTVWIMFKGEMVEFEDGSKGMALNLENDNVEL